MDVPTLYLPVADDMTEEYSSPHTENTAISPDPMAADGVECIPEDKKNDVNGQSFDYLGIILSAQNQNSWMT
jgi:hypothetical protein